MKNLYLVALLVGVLCLDVSAQQLPIWLTSEERAKMSWYYSDYRAGNSFEQFTSPPAQPARTMAEWEEIQALIITWTSYPEVLREIVRHAKLECQVVIICSNANSVRNYLQNYNINDDNLTFLERPYDSVWMRDYGANTIYLNDVDSLGLVDWIYNRPRPNDDVLPLSIAEEFDVPLYSTTAAPSDLVHTGGNFMVDGLGTAFSSELVLEENEPGNSYNVTPKSEQEIDQIMYDFMGVHTYIKMPVLPYDGIHHIDMHMKLLDEETLLVGEYPPGVADGPQIEANLQYVLDNYNSAFGTPYEVVRVQMPPDNGNYPDTWWADYRTYTNSVFVNKTVLVPIYEEQFDSTALRIMEESLPGYNIVGIDCNDIIQASGALHCITRAVGVNDPLWIVHQSLRDTDDTANDYVVDANIKHRSGIASATLHYRLEGETGYIGTSMSMTDPSADTWTAYIPAQAAGSVVQYYIEAAAVSGKSINRPLPAPEGYWDFKVTGDPTTVVDLVSAGVAMGDIFPNPASAITCIPISSEKHIRHAEIELVDLHGRRVALVHEGEIKRGDNKFFIFAEDFPAGTYFVRMHCNEGTISNKLIIR